MNLTELVAKAEKVRLAVSRAICIDSEVRPALTEAAVLADAVLGMVRHPCEALFDGREPTTNERHLLNLLSWRESENAELRQRMAAMEQEHSEEMHRMNDPHPTLGSDEEHCHECGAPLLDGEDYTCNECDEDMGSEQIPNDGE